MSERFVRYGKPKYICNDIGSGSKAVVLQTRLYTVNAKPICIYPGSDTRTGTTNASMALSG
ncbi:MAG: hypothetical protein OXK72_05030 [Gammaproteobacteria bacterium]|nr:hypothetical protein [Gammaproteobacteria bacterium]